MKVKITYTPCLFDESTWIRFESYNENVLAIFISLFQRHPEVREDSPNLSVRINGRKIHPLLWGNPLKDGDEVLIVQEIGWSTIIYTAFWAGIVTWSTAQVAFAAAPFLTAAIFIASLAYTIYSYCTAPSAPSTGKGLNSSPTYGWEGLQMQSRQGVPVPVVYGEHSKGGMICHFISE